MFSQIESNDPTVLYKKYNCIILFETKSFNFFIFTKEEEAYILYFHYYNLLVEIPNKVHYCLFLGGHSVDSLYQRNIDYTRRRCMVIIKTIVSVCTVH